MEISKYRIAGLTALIVAVSAAVLYWTVDMDSMRKLSDFRLVFLPGVVVVIAAGMYFDALRLIRLSSISGESVTMVAALRVVFGNYFMALLTPGAAGGAVIQVLFLKKAGMPTGKATIVVLIRTVLSILFLICCLPVVFFFDPQILPWFEQGGIVKGASLLMALTILTMLTLRTKLADRLAVIVLKRLPSRYRLPMMKVYRDMRGAMALMAQSPAAVLWAFAESAISLLFLYAMVPLLFMGLDVDVAWPRVMGRMIFLNLLLYFAPTPGGAVIAEGLFVSSFSPFIPLGTVGIASIAWRILAEYIPACIGGYFTVTTFGMKIAQK